MSNGFEERQPQRLEYLVCGIVELFSLSIWLVVDDPAREAARSPPRARVSSSAS